MKKLKTVNKSKNPGLAKLPKEVRNKMGYMKEGGSNEPAGSYEDVIKNQTKSMGAYYLSPKFRKIAKDVLLSATFPGASLKGREIKSTKKPSMTMKRKSVKVEPKKMKEIKVRKKMMDGGQVQSSSQIGDSVATYQGNGNYKAGE